MPNDAVFGSKLEDLNHFTVAMLALCAFVVIAVISIVIIFTKGNFGKIETCDIIIIYYHKSRQLSQNSFNVKIVKQTIFHYQILKMKL